MSIHLNGTVVNLLSEQRVYTMRVITREAQGKRPYMEDRHCDQKVGSQDRLIGIFDGHGGSEVAVICETNFPLVVHQGLTASHDIGHVLKNTFFIIDKLVGQVNKPYVGSTAVVVLVTPASIWFANAGDSMAMVAYNSDTVDLMSFEHKVENEKQRIEGEGGRITYDDGCARIEQTLNVSRSIGDYHMKRHVICEPYIRSISREFKNIKYVLLASDGVWDVFNTHTIHDVIKNNKSPEAALDIIVNIATNLGSDNVTVTYIDWTD